MTTDKTIIEFGCNLTVEEKYNLLMSGNFSVFEMYKSDGEISGYRGCVRGIGITGVYSTYREACEASFLLEKEELSE
jgi:hypothetical protein